MAMDTNEDVFRRHHFDRLPEPVAPAWGIRMHSGVWWGKDGKWVDDKANAERFEFNLAADSYAMLEQLLDPSTYSVERI